MLRQADVQIVWRGELDPADTDSWPDWIEACPPLPGEVMQVPIGEARRWLAHMASGDVADVEGRAGADDAPRASRRFRIWRNGEVRPGGEQPRPGDTVIVSTDEGGADRWGWNPRRAEPVADIADAAMERAGRRLIRRLSPRLIASTAVDAATWDEYAELSDRAVLEDLHQRGVLDAPRGKLLRRQGTGIPLAVVLRASDAVSEDDAVLARCGKAPPAD